MIGIVGAEGEAFFPDSSSLKHAHSATGSWILYALPFTNISNPALLFLCHTLMVLQFQELWGT